MVAQRKETEAKIVRVLLSECVRPTMNKKDMKDLNERRQERLAGI